MMTQPQNNVLLEGIPLAAPEFSHETHDTRFYRFFMDIPRMSGQSDHIPVLLPEPLVPQVQPGVPLRVQGQMRSFLYERTKRRPVVMINLIEVE